MWPFSKPKKVVDDRADRAKALMIKDMASDMLFLVPFVQDGVERVGLLSSLKGGPSEQFMLDLVGDLSDTARSILAVRGYNHAFFFLSAFHSICYTRAVTTLSTEMSLCTTLNGYLLSLSCEYLKVNLESLSLFCGLSSAESEELLKLADSSNERYDSMIGNFINSFQRG